MGKTDANLWTSKMTASVKGISFALERSISS